MKEISFPHIKEEKDRMKANCNRASESRSPIKCKAMRGYITQKYVYKLFEQFEVRHCASAGKGLSLIFPWVMTQGW